MKEPISPEEQARRRKLVEQAHWHNVIAGLGEPFPETAAIAELWITGKITREERRRRMEEVLEKRLVSRKTAR